MQCKYFKHVSKDAEGSVSEAGTLVQRGFRP